MSTDTLTNEAKRENAAMLAAALGIGVEAAGEALQFEVAITADPTDATATAIAADMASLLGRTIRSATLGEADEAVVLEILIGDVGAKAGRRSLRIHVGSEGAVIGGPHVLCLLVACYAAAATMQAIFQDRLPFGSSPLRVSFDQFGIEPMEFEAPVDIGHAYLAGAGAIGNGFLWAARHLDFRGTLDIADDDDVSSGNLNRQIWFTKDDIGLPKADRLAALAQGSFPRLKLIPRRLRLQDLPEKSNGPWLERLFVAVDSRRARRIIQREFPGEVFDASTTDIREVVIHHHKQPTLHACLSCIYEADQEEFTREHHIAEHLGVSAEEVRSERISDPAAKKIAARIPNLEASALVGIAYDTLFKQLCGEGTLQSLEGRRIVAPFAFVSVLAGTLLALEVLRRRGAKRGAADCNYWRVSPWHAPRGRRRVMRPRQPGCEFCDNPVKRCTLGRGWSEPPQHNRRRGGKPPI
nr:ThiF family adenylyltransferase [Bradyrhizobium sp. 2S1]MCK7664827.1 ThiF family adenylyltransferase [Bradyrhizobium sp. 2S1]